MYNNLTMITLTVKSEHIINKCVGLMEQICLLDNFGVREIGLTIFMIVRSGRPF